MWSHPRSAPPEKQKTSVGRAPFAVNDAFLLFTHVFLFFPTLTLPSFNLFSFDEATQPTVTMTGSRTQRDSSKQAEK